MQYMVGIEGDKALSAGSIPVARLQRCAFRHTSTFPRRDPPELFAQTPPQNRGSRESRVPVAPAASRPMEGGHERKSLQVQPERPGLPCAMVYDFLRALLGVLGFLVTVALIIISRLGTNRGVPGPRAFAVRVCVTRHATHLASIASIPRSWRSRSAPHWDGMRAYSF
jgi:hypothetical protein